MKKIKHTTIMLGLLPWLAGCQSIMDIYQKGDGVSNPMSSESEIALVDVEQVSTDEEESYNEKSLAERYFLEGEYYRNLGGAEALIKASNAYFEASKLNHMQANTRLGEMFLSGEGVEKNPALAAKWLNRAANQGSIDAQTALGAMYEFGLGIPADTAQAEHWYTLAAAREDDMAMLALSRLWLKQPQLSYEQANDVRHYLEKDVFKTNPQARYLLAHIHLHGLGGPTDTEQADILLRDMMASEIEQNILANLPDEHLLHQTNLHFQALHSEANVSEKARENFLKGVRYELGQGQDVNWEKAVLYYEKAAAKGDPAAMIRLANMHLQGKGTPISIEKAWGWLALLPQEAAVEAHKIQVKILLRESIPNWSLIHKHLRAAAVYNDPESLYLLSVMHQLPVYGVEQDIHQSVQYYIRAEKQSGNALAKFRVGTLLAKGVGFEQDLQHAYRWYLNAAQQGVAQAQLALGEMFWFGKGVQADALEAVRWFEKASESDLSIAYYNLAVMYLKGVPGLTQDSIVGAKWLKKAAQTGYIPAQFRLAQLYSNGEGVGQNDVEAYAWWEISQHKRYEKTYPAFQALIQRMTPEERAKGVALANHYRETIPKVSWEFSLESI